MGNFVGIGSREKIFGVERQEAGRGRASDVGVAYACSDSSMGGGDLLSEEVALVMEEGSLVARQGQELGHVEAGTVIKGADKVCTAVEKGETKEVHRTVVARLAEPGRGCAFRAE